MGTVEPRCRGVQLSEVNTSFTSNYVSPEEQSMKYLRVQAKTNRKDRKKKILFSKLHLLGVSRSESTQNDLITRKIIIRRIFKEKNTQKNGMTWFGEPKIAVLFIYVFIFKMWERNGFLLDHFFPFNLLLAK